MTLNDAMESLLNERGQPMSARELAVLVNERGLYTKRDTSPVGAEQIRARARRYPHVFLRIDGRVALARWEGDRSEAVSARTIKSNGRVPESSVSPREQASRSLEQLLLAPASFRPAGSIDPDVPDLPGLYAIRINDVSMLPAPFSTALTQRGHDLVYLGIARISLRRRFLGQELRARGHGTFFRSMGAMLGHRPAPGSLSGKLNTRNYRFTPADNATIIEWINQNLSTNWVEFAGAHQVEESGLIRRNLPLMNLQGNPAAMRELSVLRAECVRVANAPTP